MKPGRITLIFLLTCAMTGGLARAEVALENLLPLYSGLQFRALTPANENTLMVTGSDDARAVMIYFRKTLVYNGWQVVEGHILQGDRIVVFVRGGKRLTMSDDTADGGPARILFHLSR